MITIPELDMLNLGNLLRSISGAFAGKYTSENEDIIKMKKEIYDIHLSSCLNDKENLSQDAKNIIEDLNKALDEYHKIKQ